MPAPRGVSNWPSVGERQVRCVLQYASPTTDTMGGRGEPTWTNFGGPWFAKVNVVPFIVNETQAAMLYEVEGPYRADLIDYFTGRVLPPGITGLGGIGIRIVAKNLTLKVFQVENPKLVNRTLVAHCANAINTQ